MPIILELRGVARIALRAPREERPKLLVREAVHTFPDKSKHADVPAHSERCKIVFQKCRLRCQPYFFQKTRLKVIEWLQDRIECMVRRACVPLQETQYVCFVLHYHIVDSVEALTPQQRCDLGACPVLHFRDIIIHTQGIVENASE